MTFGRRFITHIVRPGKYPPAGELEPIYYYTRKLGNNGEYYLGKSLNHFPKSQIEGLSLEGIIVKIEKEIPLEENRTLLCNSIGEVIYANRKDTADDTDPIFVLKLAPANP